MSEHDDNTPKRYWYFTLVGVSPLAVSNSLIWFFRRHPTVHVEEIRFIASEPDPTTKKGGTKGQVEDIITFLHEDAASVLKPNPFKTEVHVNKDDIIEIPEADLPRAITIIAQHVKDVPPDRGYIFDLTAGRKAMGNALMCVGLLTHAKWKREVKFHYYLLKKFTREMMSKRATELARDDVESLLYDIKDITSAFSRLH